MMLTTSEYFITLSTLAIFLDLKKKYSVCVHSYTLMSSFFEFLATFKNSEDLPKFMQTLGRVYVRFYNKKYNRTGTLWGSRYKASLVVWNCVWRNTFR